MSTSSNTYHDLAEKGETRVMGLGVGVFLIFFFSIVSIFMCLIGVTTPRPGAFACTGAGLLGIVLFVLLVAEKESRYVEDESDQLQEYDQGFYPRIILVLVLSLAAILGFVGVCTTHMTKPLHASPIYDQRLEARIRIF